MKRWYAIFTVIFILGSVSLLLAQPDRTGSKDPPLFNRMPDYWIQTYIEKDFDRYEFPTGKNKTAVEGHFYNVRYFLNTGAKAASAVAIMRNYQNAVKAIGGQTIYEAPYAGGTTLKLVKNGSEYWTYVSMMNTQAYAVTMVIKSAMVQDIAITAQSIAQNIQETGKASLSGIYFDTDKAEVKPESEPALAEIAKYLQQDPKLNFYVVGHTDNVGAYEANLKLSKDRADAVVKVLTTKYEIAGTRLMACGDGPTAPVASNATEDGRAKNRRVELVLK